MITCNLDYVIRFQKLSTCSLIRWNYILKYLWSDYSCFCNYSYYFMDYMITYYLRNSNQLFIIYCPFFISKIAYTGEFHEFHEKGQYFLSLVSESETHILYRFITHSLKCTFMHLADAFIQSDLQCIQAIHLWSVCVFPGNWTHNLLRC